MIILTTSTVRHTAAPCACFHRLHKEYKGKKNSCSPGALPAPPARRPWQQCCVCTMGAVSCSCFLFPVSVSWYYSPKRKLLPSLPPFQHTPSHLLSDAAPRLAVKGPVRPFITTSQHLGSCAVHHPITWPADLPLHRAIVLSLRGFAQWPRRQRQHVLSLRSTAGFGLQSVAPSAPWPSRRRLRRMRRCSRLDLSRLNQDEEAEE